jgi:hypothetical protein
MQKASLKPFKEDAVQWFRALWKDHGVQQRTRGRRYRGWGLEGRLGMQGNQPTEFSGHMRSVAYSRAIDVECKLPDPPAECADGDFEGGVIDKRHWLQVYRFAQEIVCRQRLERGLFVERNLLIVP